MEAVQKVIIEFMKMNIGRACERGYLDVARAWEAELGVYRKFLDDRRERYEETLYESQYRAYGEQDDNAFYDQRPGGW